MKFTFQNAGEGGGCGDSFENQVWCVTQNVSPDVDVVHCKFLIDILVEGCLFVFGLDCALTI